MDQFSSFLPFMVPLKAALKGAMSSALDKVPPKLTIQPINLDSSPLRYIISSSSKMLSSSSEPTLMAGVAKGIKTARVTILKNSQHAHIL